MTDRPLTTAAERQIDARVIAPVDFRYPERYARLISINLLPEIDPFMWTSEFLDQAQNWARIVEEQYPGRVLVPFAKHQDTDDVFCFDGNDRSGDPPVLIIHTFASPGWEYRGQWRSFDVWWEEMEAQRAAWLAEQEDEGGADAQA